MKAGVKEKCLYVSLKIIHCYTLHSVTSIKSVLQCVPKSDAKVEITITATNFIRIKYPLSSLNCLLCGANVANFNKIQCTL